MDPFYSFPNPSFTFRPQFRNPNYEPLHLHYAGSQNPNSLILQSDFTFPNSNANINPNPNSFLPPRPTLQSPKLLIPQTDFKPPDLEPNAIFQTASEPRRDIRETISLLEEFINRAVKSVESITEILYADKKESEFHTIFSSCPFNALHRMPPEFLFRHSLRCSSSPAVLDLEILDSLHYPHSLKSDEELQKENHFVQSLPDSNLDLCFSLDESNQSKSNFFYKDCPGVVTSSDHDSISSTFSLPRILSLQCANFISTDHREICVDSNEKTIILPSELWLLRRELETWNNFPVSYSYVMLRITSSLQMIKKLDISKWVISNSPCYGIVIDTYMRDHICLILKLCLKAISREAFHLQKSCNQNRVGEIGLSGYSSFTYDCPCLVESLKWLASQLSILYGERNGKQFSIDMIKQCLLDAASNLLLIPLDHNHENTISDKKSSRSSDASLCNKDCPLDHNHENTISDKKSSSSSDASLCNKDCAFIECEVNANADVKNSSETSSYESKFSVCSQIFVSQIAAAISALHERSQLEERIKKLRLATPIQKSHLVEDCTLISKIADEERAKRPNYRALLEHDGFLWHRPQDQESNKIKTREELLAEERDYKRRRISYRGKKAKRSTTEVLRDLIEEHMEEIKLAGGIGVSGTEKLTVEESTSIGDVTLDLDQSRKIIDNSSGIKKKPSGDSRRDMLSKYHGRLDNFSTPELLNSEDIDDRSSSPRRNKQSTSKNNWGRDYRSTSSMRHKSHSRSIDRHENDRERESSEKLKHGGCESSSSHRHKYHERTSSRYKRKDQSQNAESRQREKRRIYDQRSSESVVKDNTEDRYDPSSILNPFEELTDPSCSKYEELHILYSPRNHGKKSFEKSSRRSHHDHHQT